MTKKVTSGLWAIGFAAVLSACGGGGSEMPSPPPETDAGGALQEITSGNAKVAGLVKFEGTPPAPEEIDASADPNCEARHSEHGGKVKDLSVVVGENGGLAGVVVQVVGASGPQRAEAVEIDQVGCLYEPKVVALQAGQKLVIKNSDPFMHNVNIHAKANPADNIAMPNVMTKEKTFTEPETIEVTCDVHGWMKAYIVVLDTPFYATTGEDGSFSIEGLPAGSYTLKAWHPVLGERTAEFEVADGGSAEVEIAFSSGA